MSWGSEDPLHRSNLQEGWQWLESLHLDDPIFITDPKIDMVHSRRFSLLTVCRFGGFTRTTLNCQWQQETSENRAVG
jgi:hypothetical protein